MLTLTSITHVIRAVIGTAGALHVKCSAMDVDASGVVTVPSMPNLVITGSGTQTLIPAPSVGKQRNVKAASVVNASPSVSTTFVLEDFDGTIAATLLSVTLLPGERLALGKDGVWRRFAANGAEYGYTVVPYRNLGPTGTLGETVPRELCPETNTTGPATGVLWMQAIYLNAGDVINNIELWSATTAAGTPTNQMAGIYDINRNLVAGAANKTTEAWSANSAKQFALTAPYRVPTSGMYYIGFFVTATTMPTYKGFTARTGGQLGGATPALGGSSASTGLTTALPSTAGVITQSTATIYARVL